MNATRSLARFRCVLIIPLVIAAMATPSAYAREEIIIREAPPPVRVEPVPGPRQGYVWDQGHWRWQHGGYVWMPGHWQPVRYNGRWQPGHWQARGPSWYWIEGRWIR